MAQVIERVFQIASYIMRNTMKIRDAPIKDRL